MKHNEHKFLLNYIFLGCLGTAAIVLLAPFCRVHSLPPPLTKIHNKLQSCEMVRLSSDLLRRRLLFNISENPVSSDGVPDTPRTRVNQSRPAAPVSPTSSGTAETEEAEKPACWGVTVVPNAGAYDKNGKFLRRLKAGTTLDIVSVDNTRSGKFVFCRLSSQTPSSQPIAVRQEDVSIIRGELALVTSRERSLHVAKAQLSTQISLLQKAQRESLKADNPHAAGYAAARTAYDAYWKRVSELKRKMDSAVGSERIKYHDSLRTMKGDDIRLGQAYEDAKRKYNAWNAAQADSPPSSSPKLASLEKEIALLERQIEEWKGRRQ